MVYWKGIICGKSDLPVINLVCEKVWFTINGLPKMLFFNFCLFHFSKFQMTIVKSFMEKLSFFVNDFESSFDVRLCHKYFWSTNVWEWNDGPFKTILNFHGNGFFFFIFSKWKKYYGTFTILLMIHLQRTVVHYVNLNSSPTNKPYLGAVGYAISCFRFLIYVYLNEAFVKNFMKKLSFLIQISKTHFKM